MAQRRNEKGAESPERPSTGRRGGASARGSNPRGGEPRTPGGERPAPQGRRPQPRKAPLRRSPTRGRGRGGRGSEPESAGEIPEKLQFKIGEVSRLVGVEPYVLRFWESEFSQIRPRKGANGHRIYTRADVVTLRRIRTLLHQRRYTIAGARALLAEGEEAVEAVLSARPVEAAAELSQASEEVSSLRASLKAAIEERDALKRRLEGALEEAAFYRTRLSETEQNRAEWARRLGARLEALAARIRARSSDDTESPERS